MKSSFQTLRAASFFLGVVFWFCPVGATAADSSYILEVQGPIPADLEEIVAAAGGTVHRVHPEINTVVARSSASEFTENILQTGYFGGCVEDLMSAPTEQVEVLDFVEAGPTVGGVGGLTSQSSASVVPPVDPRSGVFFSCQWHIPLIGIGDSWDQGVFGDPGYKVAHISSGTDPDHLSLAGTIDLDQSVNLLTPGTSPCEPALADESTIYDFHGFGVAGQSLIATSGFAISGAAPSTKVVAVKALNCQHRGLLSDIVAGILYAAGLDDVAVINVPFNFYIEKDGVNHAALIRPLKAALNVAFKADKVVFAMAGDEGLDLDNDGNMISVPAELSKAISIYSTRRNRTIPFYTSFGQDATQLGAPGGFGLPGGGGNSNPFPPIPGCPIIQGAQASHLVACSSKSPPTNGVPVTCTGRTFVVVTLNGEFAAAIASGSMALIAGEADGTLKPNQLRELAILTATDLGEPGTDPIFSNGEINPGAAITQILAGTSTE